MTGTSTVDIPWPGTQWVSEQETGCPFFSQIDPTVGNDGDESLDGDGDVGSNANQRARR